MPYIEKSRRADFESFLAPLKAAVLEASEGDMNYLLTTLVWHHVTHGGATQLRYADIQEAVGLLECVKQEFYRRVAGPYEEMAMSKNGDVYVR